MPNLNKEYNPYKMDKVEIELPELTEEDHRIAEIDDTFKQAMEIMAEPSEENLSAAIALLQAIE